MILNQTYRSSVVFHHYFFKKAVPFLKNSSLFSVIRPKPILLKKTGYKLIYEFSLVQISAAIARSSFTCILLSVTSSPFLYYYCEPIVAYIVLFGAGIHFILGLGFSSLFNNIVGKIYVNKEEEVKNVMISSLDKFGRRIDRIHNANDLINCEYHTKFTQQIGIIQISVKNSDLHYKVNIRNCKIHDPSIWENLFGKFPFPKLIRKCPTKTVETKKIE